MKGKIKKMSPVLVAAGLMMAAAPLFAQNTLEENFLNPPSSAKAYTWWHWMNGNISKEGITADLEAMKEAGVGGVQCFNVGFLTEGPVKYASDQWYDVTSWAIKEAERLGLEFDLHNCPGWSSSGGFWITPENAAKQLSWSEVFVKGGDVVDMTLPLPDKAMDRYWDALVVAYPSTAGENLTEGHLVRVTADGKDISKTLLSVSDRTAVTVEKELLLEFDRDYPVSTVRGFIRRLSQETPSGMGGFMMGNQGPAGPSLEVSVDGKKYIKVGNVNVLTGCPSYASFSTASAKYLRISTGSPLSIEGLAVSSAPMNRNFLRESDYVISVGSSFGQPFPSSRGESVEDRYLINPDDVMDITRFMDKDGHLRWKAPEGDWTVVRLGYVPIERRQQSAPPSGNGLEIDKYSREALKFHWDYLIERLMPEMESIAGKSKAGILIDSYETGNMNWTPKMRDEFKKRRGYDLAAYIPALVGKYVGSVDETEDFLWDFRRTCADLFADNYLGYMAELCHEHGILLYNEPYNTAMFDEMQVGSRADIPMGEFWVRTHQDRLTVKLASSVAHVNGKRLDGNQIVGAESYTGWEPDAAYQNFPYSLKAQGDDAFTLGLNRFIFHRFAHQPNNNVSPGMSMGNIGFHFDRNNTWFKMGKQWLTYAARCQYLLQQGNIVADVLYLLDEQVPVSAHRAWNPEVPAGYWGDQVNRESFLGKINVDGGKLTGPEGVEYGLLVMENAPERLMSLDVLEKIYRYVSSGGRILGTAPKRLPGISSESEKARWNELVDSLWGGIDGNGRKTVGSGEVFTGMDMKEVLSDIGIAPDVEYSFAEDAPLGFIHRAIGGTDVYFLANHRRTFENLVVTFRADGRRPELWNPDTGEILPLDMYDVKDDGRISVDLNFDPVGSWFVVFREKGHVPSAKGIWKDGARILSASAWPEREGGLMEDIHDNFTMSMWLRVEPNSSVYSVDPAHRPAFFWGSFANSYPFYPGDPEELYGKGHSVVAVDATRSGVAVMEKSGGQPVCVASYDHPLGSWNHVAVVYRDDTPYLYVNGELVYTGKKSSHIVHPSYKDIAVSDSHLSFEGDFASFNIVGRPLSGDEIKDEFSRRDIAGTGYGPEVRYTTDGKYYFFANGKYDLEGTGKSVSIGGIPDPLSLDASGWTVSFTHGLGAPDSIKMDRLKPLQENPDEGVRHFSGTATYRTSFRMSKSDLKGKEFFLDLGRVYVIATVRLNGENLGILWKAPYSVDITSALKEGENVLEVDVANLWPNRLIGDAEVPDGQEKGGMFQAPLPEWYQKGEAKPDDGRVAYSVAKFYDKDDLLYDSGLAGPVVIRAAIKK